MKAFKKILFRQQKNGQLKGKCSAECTQPAITCSTLTIETLEKSVKYAQS